MYALSLVQLYGCGDQVTEAIVIKTYKIALLAIVWDVMYGQEGLASYCAKPHAEESSAARHAAHRPSLQGSRYEAFRARLELTGKRSAWEQLRLICEASGNTHARDRSS